MTEGTIFNIEHYAIHDGPGIRSTVFFKGCPLSCLWCHNPEGLSPKPQLVYYRDRCRNCRKCLQRCPNEALSIERDGIVINSERCRLCGECAAKCPAQALEMVGRRLSPREVIDEVKKDRLFYEESGGGVTFSGGEPFTQPEFLTECLKLAKAAGLHTAIETSGFAPRAAIEEAAAYVDLFLFDIKHLDAEEHKRYTGVDNALIKENLRRLSEMGERIILRMAVIPGVNDGEEALNALCRFLNENASVEAVNLLPLHKSAAEKYRRLGRKFTIADFEIPNEERMNIAASIFKKSGFRVTIGGQ